MEAPHKIELGINPEARPGPADTVFLFDRFGKMMKEAER